MQTLQNEVFSSAALFVIVGIALGAFLEFVVKTFGAPIPYTVLVFYVGIVFALIRNALNISLGEDIEEATVSSDLIIYVFLPALLFNETMNLNWLHVKQSFPQAVLLAGPGAIIVAAQLAVVAKFILPFDWSWLYSFLFGGILCATDPVSVVDLLKRTGASSRLSTVIAGESLLNDGAAMILYFFVLNLILGKTYTASSFLEFVAKMIIVSPLIGFAFGIITYMIMKKIHQPTNLHIDIQIVLTFICGYASFYVAESKVEVSGVLACCSAGVTLAFFASPKILAHERMHEVWHNVEWVCNTLIFLLGGLVGGDHANSYATPRNIGFLIVMYAFVNITRVAMTVLLYPILSRVGMKCDSKDATFMAYAGLRGALAIALALDSTTYDYSTEEKETGNQIFFVITGVVSMTLLLNGSTAGWLLLYLNLVEDPNAPVSTQKQQVMDRIKRFLRKLIREELSLISGEFGDYDPKEVARLCRLMNKDLGVIDADSLRVISDADGSGSAPDPQALLRGLPSPSLGSSSGGARVLPLAGSVGGGATGIEEGAALDSSDGSAEESSRMVRVSKSTQADRDLLVFLRTTFLDIVRARYLDSVKTGKIGSSATASKMLLYSVDVASDYVKDGVKDWDCIQKNLTSNMFILRMFEIVDDACALFRLYPGLVSRMDANYERIAIYVLTNFIDAHNYALEKIHYYLGADDRNFEIAGPEERQLKIEVEGVVAYAKYHLSSIEQSDVRKINTHRAAKVIILKQFEILQRMQEEGALSENLALRLFQTIEDDTNRIDLERDTYDRSFVRETFTRKLNEEKEIRESLSKLSPAAAQAAAMGDAPFTTRNSLRLSLMGEDTMGRLSMRAGVGGGLMGTPMNGAGAGGAGVGNPLQMRGSVANSALEGEDDDKEM